MKQTDVLQVVVSDFHSGSNYALFLADFWQGKHQNHTPTSKQVAIRQQFEKFADHVKAERKGKKVILVHNGDAIDGDHHNSGDVCSIFENEQKDIHVSLMAEFQKRIDWQRGDELYYTKGTDAHGREMEEAIAAELNAVMNGDEHCWQFLELETNGRLSWFIHHGPGRGMGANEGNQMRNWLKNIYFDCAKDGKRVPDIMYTGHVHDATYSTYEWRREMEFYLMHGIITPSWQAKTNYAYMRAPVSRNRIGGVIHEIKADGTICVPKFCVM